MRKPEEPDVPVVPETRADDLSTKGDIPDDVAEDFAERMVNELNVPSIR